MTSTPRVSVVIGAYDTAETIAGCLEALRRQTYRDFEVVLIDSSSDQETVQIAAAFPEVAFEHSPSRLYCHEARNRAIVRSRGELLACLDADVYPRPDWLTELVAAYDRTGQVIVGALACHGSRLLDRGIHLCKFAKFLPDHSLRQAFLPQDIPPHDVLPDHSLPQAFLLHGSMSHFACPKRGYAAPAGQTLGITDSRDRRGRPSLHTFVWQSGGGQPPSPGSDSLPHDLPPHDVLRDNSLPDDSLPHGAMPLDILPRDVIADESLRRHPLPPGAAMRVIDTAPTANLLVARADFERAGGLRGGRHLADVTLGRSLVAGGRQLMFAGTAVGAHHHRQSLREFLTERYVRGALFGQLRSGWLSGRAEIALFLAVSVLPVRLAKITGHVIGHCIRGRQLGTLLITFPIVLAGHAAWLAGESASYARALFTPSSARAVRSP